MSRVWVYQVASFLSAFLFFQIQPMVSSAILPAFGGSCLVWGICMVFFQAVLLLGYFYVHAVHRWAGVFSYSRLHWFLLLLPLLVVSGRFVVPGDSMTGQMPVALSVVVILALSVGVPAFALSTTSLMLQKWLLHSNVAERTNPYVLYSGSNMGSILGLLTYPLIVEPFLTLDMQWHVWIAGYVCVAGLHLFCMPVRRPAVEESGALSGSLSALRRGQALRWFSLGAAGTALLLAVTNVLTQDLASVPFLWVVPLSAYLMAYVLTFKQKTWYPAWWPDVGSWAVILGLLLHVTTQLRMALPVPVSIVLLVFILFAICLSCCRELVCSKPEDTDRGMTTFYLVIAAGGLAGSLVVAWIMPLVSRSLIEFPLALVFAVISLAAVSKRGVIAADNNRRMAVLTILVCGVVSVLALTLLPSLAVSYGISGAGKPLMLVLTAAPVTLALRWVVGRPWQFASVLLMAGVSLIYTEDIVCGGRGIQRFRNYYGIYRVYDSGNIRYLQHGTTLHGRQYISGPKAGAALSYYHSSGPAGVMLESTNFFFKRIGMIGLGTGAMAAYAGKGQTFKIYELDPGNIPIAEKNFTYMQRAVERGAQVSVVTGDGRISMMREKDGALDLLMIDAFNSGSIPVHLITVEAMKEYFRVLGKEGLLLIHVSNRFLDLSPVVHSNARFLDASACDKSNIGNVDPDADATRWMALCMDPAKIDLLVVKMGWSHGVADRNRLPRPWTDRYSNLFGALLKFSPVE